MPDNMFNVLRLAWTEPFTVSSNFARVYAVEVACASSRGLITTRIDRDKYGKKWLITPKGIAKIWEFRR